MMCLAFAWCCFNMRVIPKSFVVLKEQGEGAPKGVPGMVAPVGIEV